MAGRWSSNAIDPLVRSIEQAILDKRYETQTDLVSIRLSNKNVTALTKAIVRAVCLQLDDKWVCVQSDHFRRNIWRDHMFHVLPHTHFCREPSIHDPWIDCYNEHNEPPCRCPKCTTSVDKYLSNVSLELLSEFAETMLGKDDASSSD